MLGPFAVIINWTEPMTLRLERFQKDGEFGPALAQRTAGLNFGSLIQIFDWNQVTQEAVDMAEGKKITSSKVIPLEALCKSRSVINKLSFSELLKALP